MQRYDKHDLEIFLDECTLSISNIARVQICSDITALNTLFDLVHGLGIGLGLGESLDQGQSRVVLVVWVVWPFQILEYQMVRVGEQI